MARNPALRRSPRAKSTSTGGGEASSAARPRWERLAFWGAALALAVATVVGAARVAWITDDALIDFRYVDNALAGHGLVFNPGERVEAFSSPLYVLLLLPLRALGADPFAAARVLGIAFTLLEFALLVAVLRRVTRSRLVPLVAAALFATERIVHVWATGGLETSLFSLLCTGSFALSIGVRDRLFAGAGKSAALHVALAAARPEGLAYYPLHLGVLVRDGWRDGSWKKTALRSAAFVAVAVGALLALRWAYYGALLPHAHAAKVQGVPLATFGWGYLGAFLARLGFTGPLVIGWAVLAAFVLFALLASYRTSDTAAGDAPAGTEPTAGLVRVVLVGLGYVLAAGAWAVLGGGDYMTDFRFLRPVMGVLFAVIATAVGLVLRSPLRHPRFAAGACLAAMGVVHGARQLAPTAVFADAPEPAAHKEILTVGRERADRFRAALERVAEPGDAIVADWTGFMGFGHTYRTIDCTGLTSPTIEGNFYLRQEWSEAGKRERLPGHARWPEIEFLVRERVAFIFPKVNDKPPEEPELTADSPVRQKRYPFLHVTMPLGDGQFFRFFTALSADELVERSRRKELDLCWRAPQIGRGSPQGRLECARDLGDAKVASEPTTAPEPRSPEEAVKEFFAALEAADCGRARALVAGDQLELMRTKTCAQTEAELREHTISLIEITSVVPDGRAPEERLATTRWLGAGKERTTIVKVASFDGVWKVVRW